MQVLENTPAVLSFGKLCDENGYSSEWINGQNRISSRTGFGYFATQRTSFLLWFRLVKFVLWIFIDFKDTFKTGESSSYIFLKLDYFTSRNCVEGQITVRLEKEIIKVELIPFQCMCQVHVEWTERGDLLIKPTKNPKPKKTKTTRQNGAIRLLSDLPEWLQDFRESRG